jgi:cell wall-associated NlpC family hydrolase
LSPLQEGDLLAFRIGQGVAHHLGLVTSPAGQFVHCLRGHGVIESTLQDPTYRKVLTNHFRPKWASARPTI